MAGELVTFRGDDADRISKVVRQFEKGNKTPLPAPGLPPAVGRVPTIVKITSDTPDEDGHYPAQYVSREPSIASWIARNEAVKAYPINGGKLVKNRRYTGVVTKPHLGYSLVGVDEIKGAVLSADCSGLIGHISPGSGNCLTFLLETGDGSCSCVVLQSTTLEWDDDEDAMIGVDHIYGCPPGVVTILCPNGAPLKYVLVASGFTGDCAILNGSWTFTHSTGETWTATKSGKSATAVFSGSVGLAVTTVTFSDVDGIGGSVVYKSSAGSNCCTSISIVRDSAAICAVSPASMTLTPATACGLGTAYVVILDKCEGCDGPQPRLRLRASTTSGSGGIVFSRNGCTETTSQFSTDNPLFCTGTPNTDCGPNAVRATVVCVPCSTIYRKFASIPCGPCGCTGIIEVPETLCISFALTAGTDCMAIDGHVQELPLVRGPADSPVNDGFGDTSSPTLGRGWWVKGAYTLLVSGTIKDNTQADQCDTKQYPDVGYGPPVTFSFNGGTAPNGYTLSFATGAWVLTYGTESFSTSSTDADAQTITFDVSGSELATIAFGSSTAPALTFLLGGNPEYDYEKVVSGYTYSAVLGAYGGTFCAVGAGVSAPIGQPFYPLSGVGTGWSFGPGTDDAICEISNGTTLTQTDVGYGSGGQCNSITYPTTKYTVTLVPDPVSCVPTPTVSESWNCLEDGTCIDPGDGSGVFASEIACLAACSEGGGGGGPGAPPPFCCPDVDGTEATLNIVGGIFAGTYYATWTIIGSQIIATFDIAGGATYQVVCGVINPAEPDGDWYGYLLDDPDSYQNATTHTCSPALAVTFPSTTALGATSVTVS